MISWSFLHFIFTFSLAKRLLGRAVGFLLVGVPMVQNAPLASLPQLIRNGFKLLLPGQSHLVIGFLPNLPGKPGPRKFGYEAGG